MSSFRPSIVGRSASDASHAGGKHLSLSYDPPYSRADNKSARPERKGPLQIEIVSAAMGKAMQAWAWALKVIQTPPPRMFRTENR